LRFRSTPIFPFFRLQPFHAVVLGHGKMISNADRMTKPGIFPGVDVDGLLSGKRCPTSAQEINLLRGNRTISDTVGGAVKSKTRVILKIVLILLAVAAVLAPLLVVRHDFTAFPKGSKDSLAAVADMLALFAVSFIFLDIVTGAFRPLLKKVFDPDRLPRAHIVFGVTGLLLVLVHLSLLLPFTPGLRGHEGGIPCHRRD